VLLYLMSLKLKKPLIDFYLVYILKETQKRTVEINLLILSFHLSFLLLFLRFWVQNTKRPKFCWCVDVFQNNDSRFKSNLILSLLGWDIIMDWIWVEWRMVLVVSGSSHGRIIVQYNINQIEIPNRNQYISPKKILRKKSFLRIIIFILKLRILWCLFYSNGIM